MSDSLLSKAFSDGVGRRIFAFFLFAAVVPMLFTAWLAFHEFNRQVQTQSSNELKANAKEYGIEILSRLQFASAKGAEVVRVAERDGTSAIASHAYLLSDFDAVWIMQESDEAALLSGATDTSIDTSVIDQAFLSSGGAQLLLSSDNRLVMLRAPEGPADRVFAFQLDASKIWGARENLPYNKEFCVFSQAGVRLYCTIDVDATVHSVVNGNESADTLLQWNNGEDQYHVGSWPLFLGGAFRAPSIDIIAIQAELSTLQSGADFRRVFFPAITLVLVLVAVLSLNLIARSLVPLKHLTEAAQQIAGGNLKSRVLVRTSDEFGSLAEAFNNMASRLGRQISTLEAMSGIDRLILSGTKFEGVAEDVVRHLIALTSCDAAAVIARDIDDPTKAKMISHFEGEFCHERIDLPGGMNHRWCQPRQVNIAEVKSTEAPYKTRFEAYNQDNAVLIPVVLDKELKGVLLLGFESTHKMSHGAMQRCIDLAGRFAVALASVEREEALYRQAHYDALTGLPNRQLLKDRLEQQVNSARVEEHSGAMLFLDLDRFKEINDVHGHSVGDRVLIQASERIVAEVRGRDTVARLGGDEFVIVLPNVRNESIVSATAERLLLKLGEAFNVDDNDHYLSASIGIVMFPDDGDSVETLLRNADAAMYRAKDAGRSRFDFFSERLNAESRRKISLERDLRAAIHGGELEVRYQPQFNIKTGEISGAEALLRWNHSVHGPVSPGEFIPLAEESGLIVTIGSWVIEQACKDLYAILERGQHPGPMSINVSARQLREESFVSDVLEPIKRYRINPCYVQLEVTETTVAQNRDTAIQILERLREEGVRVAIDDFGTGYSSLSYLQQMPFDVIKIDKTFVDRIGTNAASDKICRAIIRIAEELGKKSIAEGAETREQIEFLEKNGCGFVQGFFYSRAMPKDDFMNFVETQDFHTQRRKALEII
ncbi:MAG: EAL domain-containing protein [Gammaproteobacteria bacterium]|nr:EAL domain-containing protein [Gammaproteobacteria bacterium]